MTAQNAAPPIAYRRRDAAAAVGISVPELDKHIARGDIEVRRIGRVVVIPRVSLLRWLDLTDEASVS